MTETAEPTTSNQVPVGFLPFAWGGYSYRCNRRTPDGDLCFAEYRSHGDALQCGQMHAGDWADAWEPDPWANRQKP